MPITIPAATVASTPEAPTRSAMRNDAEGDDRRQRSLDKMVVGAPGERDRQRADRDADDDPAAADQQRLRPRRSGVGAPLRLSARQDQREQQRRGAVVEQALASMTSRSRPVTPVSRSSAITAIGSVAAISAPKASAGSTASRDRQTSAAGDDAGAEQHAERGEREHRVEVAPEVAPRDVQRRLEQKRRQDDVEDEVVRQGKAGVDAEERERGAGEDEAHRVRQPQTARGERDEDGETEKAERAEEQDVHAACLPGRSPNGNRAYPHESLRTRRNPTIAFAVDIR